MELLVVLLAVLVIGGAVFVASKRREMERTRNDLRLAKRVAEEDVTRFGEELQDLHIETLTTEIDAPMRQDYQRALDSYEQAKELLGEVKELSEVKGVTHALEDGRYAMACVLARQAGEPLPQRLAPCFFNAAHGPSQTEVEWAPPGGVARDIPVCLADADRLKQGAEPDVRKVRKGGELVPWYEGGPAYRSYADGYYGMAAMNGMFPVFVLGAMMSGGLSTTSPDGGFGGDQTGGDGGGFDGGGYDGGGGFDGGGFDGGGFGGDFGGF